VIQINLLPKEEQVPEPRLSLSVPRARVVLPAVIGAALLLPLGGMHAMQQARIASLRADIRQAELEMQRLKPQIDRINQLTVERADLNMRLAVIQGLTRERHVPVMVLDQLADQIPDYLWYTRVASPAPGQISLEGMTFSNLMVAELMSRMEASELFDNVALVVAERAKGPAAAARPLLSFTLTARIKG